MPAPIVGIDLGTTNSEIAFVRDRQPVVIDEGGDPILPSMVGIGSDGKLLVGHAARNQWVIAPERTVKSVKRRMGEDVKLRLGEQEYRPQEISAMILRALKDRASRYLGETVEKAVITVPAYFNDAQRQATREAGELAGLDVVRILNEPTAGSLVYDPSHSELRRVLVYDLGGGTFDVSIVQAQAGVVEVLASHGDTHLGGDDFDDLLAAHLAGQFEQQNGLDLRVNPVSRSRLLRAAETAKRTLSDHPFARLEEEFIAEKGGIALHLAAEVSRAEYETLIRPLMDRTVQCVHRALQDAALTPRQIDRIVLVGGSTRTPLVSSLLEEMLGQAPHREVNPDLCVAMGAAVQAALIAGQDVGSVLVDITPHSLGIKCLDVDQSGFGLPFLHRFAPVVKRNTPLPASRSEAFRTIDDNQPTVDVDIYQGESDDVRENHRVGRFSIEGLAPVPAGNQIVVQFDLNLDGILVASAREKATGLQKAITIENALATYRREEMGLARERLDTLWGDSFSPVDFEGEDDDTIIDADESEQEPEPMPTLATGPREGQREAVQAKALLEKAERLMIGVHPDDRADVERQMEAVRVALQDRRWSDLTSASNALADTLFYLEDA